MSKRAAKSTTRDAKSIKILAEVDEATTCLTQEDEEVIRREQTKTEKLAESDKAFVHAYRVKRQELRKAAAAAAPVKGRGRAPPGSARAKAVTPKWLPECVIGMGQPKANTFMPPADCSIWKSRRNNSWNTRFGDWPVCSRSVVRHGEESALKQVISNAWKLWCLKEGVPEDECPCKGLVADEEP